MIDLHNRIERCHRCGLHDVLPYPQLPVPGEGHAQADLMLIGEAPGETESISHQPFQGLAGVTLNSIFNLAKIERSSCYITNTVKCRPTTNEGKKNRTPHATEIQICKLWLWKELQLVNPKFAILLGKTPTYALLNSQLKKSFKLGDVFGKEFTTTFSSTIFVPCYHPSFLMQHGKRFIDQTAELFTRIRNEL